MHCYYHLNTVRLSDSNPMTTEIIPPIFLPLALWMTFAATPAIAQTDDYNRFSLSLGWFFTDRETDTRFETSIGSPGTDIDLEDELGLDKTDSAFRLDGYYRFAPKHQINFSVFDLSRTASTQIQEDISWNNTVFVVDTVLTTDFDLAIYKVDYTWRFKQRDNWYLGLTGGLYIGDFDFDLFTTNVDLFDRGGATAPLPVIGLRGEYDFSERWTFRADGEFFFLEYQDFDGSLYDVYAGLEYSFSEHMGIGVGVNTVRMNLGLTKTNLSGDLDWEYTGAIVFFRFSF